MSVLKLITERSHTQGEGGRIGIDKINLRYMICGGQRAEQRRKHDNHIVNI